MTPTIPDWARTWIGRVIAALVAGAMTWLSRKGYDALVLSPDEQKRVTEGTLIVLTTLWGTYYGPIHKWINSWINSSDSASPAMAKAATGPMGHGERTRLGEHMQEVAAPNQSEAREAERARVRKVITPTPPESVVVDEAPKPKKPRAPRKKKEPADVVKLRRATDVQPSDEAAKGFGEYVPTDPSLPKHISPRPRLTSDDSGVL